MNNFRQWYLRNQTNITWFIVGWMALAFLYDFGRGDWLWCAIDALIIWANVAFNK